MYLPQDVVYGETILTFIGRKKLKIENYRNLLVYHDETIRIQAKPYQIKILGKHLYIEYYDKDEMEICGIITTITFE